MSLPIAIGGKAVSSKLITRPTQQDDYADDGTPLRCVLRDTGPSIVTCSNYGLEANILISYSDLCKQADDAPREGTMAELRVQISPLGDAYSSAYREVLHRVLLPHSSSEESRVNQTKNANAFMQPCAVLAKDGRHLACVVPYPRGDSRSIVVVFQLRRPRKSSTIRKMPRPSYVVSDENGSHGQPHQTIRIATNPMIVTVPSDSGIDSPLYNTSCLCDLSTQLGGKIFPVLLAGCSDGSLQIITYRPAQVARVLFRTSEESSHIIFMSHETFVQFDDGECRGKLVTISHDGRAVVFESHFGHDNMRGSVVVNALSHDSISEEVQSTVYELLETQQNSFMDASETMILLHPTTKQDNSMLFIELHRLLDFEGSYSTGVWVDNRLLALVPTPRSNNEVVAHVWSLDVQWNAILLSRLVMLPDQLEECAHSSFALASSSDCDKACLNHLAGLTSLDFDCFTGCLAVSSYLVLKSKAVKPFSCVWNWRTNTVGLTIKCRGHLPINYDEFGNLLASQSAMAQLKFCKDSDGGRKLAHLNSLLSSNWTIDHRKRKAVYDTATLSPPDSIHHPRNGFRLPSPLILGSKSVSFPVYHNTSSRPSGEIEWRESRIPTSYLNSFGAPKISAIAHRYCRSIAVAASKGLCVLDCSRLDPLVNAPQMGNSNDQTHDNVFKSVSRSGHIAHPKWKLFGSENEERAFRTIAMTWWEGDTCQNKESLRVHSDDLLIAVIEREEGSKQKLYLACWSRRRLGFEHQLIRGIIPGDPSCVRFGIELPAGFSPDGISILTDPRSLTASTNRRATLLLSASCGNTLVSYCFYQLQKTDFSTSIMDKEQLDYTVYSFLASQGTVPGETPFCNAIFLASASFNFDLNCPETPTNADVFESLGTLGIIKYPGNGIHGAIMTPRGVGVVVELKPLIDVSSFFISDIVTTESDSIFVWAFELADGTVLCWSIWSNKGSDLESAFSLSQHATPPITKTGAFEPPSKIKVNDEVDTFMGTISCVGNSTMWMQDSLNQNRPDILLGHVPGSNYGCTMRVGQGCKNIHRMVPGDFDASGFASSFLDHDLLCASDTILTTPTFVVALVNFLLNKACTDAIDGKVTNIHLADFFFQHYLLVIEKDRCEASFLSTLNILIFRFVELIASSSNSGDIAKKDLAGSLYRDVARLARESLVATNFASLVVGIGRQVEPSFFTHLFPVPFESKSSNCLFVEDCLDILLQQGALNSALSTLPLLSSKSLSLDTNKSLLQHCLEWLKFSTATSGAMDFADSTRERAGLLSLARFGMQLEDMDDRDVWEDAVREIAPSIIPLGVNDNVKLELTTVIPKRGQSTISSSGSLVFSLFCRSRRPTAVQSGITDAARGFISSGFEASGSELTGIGKLGIITGLEKNGYINKVENMSIAETLAEFLSCFLTVTENNLTDTKWKRLSLMGQIMLGPGSANLSDLLPPDTTAIMNAAEEATLEELSAFVQALSNHDIDDSLDSADMERDIVDFFVVNFLCCQHEVSKNNASQLLDLILLILTRVNKEGRNKFAMKCGLLLIGVVVGHVSDRIGDIFDYSTKCPLFLCYKLAEEDSEGIV